MPISKAELAAHGAGCPNLPPHHLVTIGAPTVVNVREVGIFVEELVENVRDEHRKGLVRVAPGMTPLEIRTFGQFVITP
jgi:hypothetical protein